MLKKELLNNIGVVANYVITPGSMNGSDGQPAYGWYVYDQGTYGDINPKPDSFNYLYSSPTIGTAIGIYGIDVETIYINRLDTFKKIQIPRCSFAGFVFWINSEESLFTEEDIGKPIPLYIDLSEVLGGG